MQRVVFSGNCKTLSLKVRLTAKQQQQQKQSRIMEVLNSRGA